MNIFAILATVIGIVLYFPLCFQIWKGTVKQNFATWILWGLIDGIVAASLIVQKGNWLLPATYMFGATTTALIILKFNKTKWRWQENVTLAMAAGCMIIWAISGPRYATIASTMASFFSGAPQAVDSYEKPHESPFWIFVCYTFANALAIFGGKSWTIEERFFPSMMTVLTIIFISLTLRRFWTKPEDFQTPKK